MSLDPSALSKLNQAYFSEHPDEEAVLARLPDLLEHCRHFVDIGASLGQYAFAASRIMRGGHIDAFEADLARAETLKQSMAKWAGEASATMAAHHLAVGRTSGIVTFYSTNSNVSGGLFPNALTHLDAETRARTEWTTMQVSAVSLDEFYRDATPDFIKMDIEGAEGDALLGAIALIRKRQTSWLIELHGFENGWQPHQVIDFMRSHRYRETELAPDRFLFAPMGRVEHIWRAITAVARRALGRARALAGGGARRLRNQSGGPT